MQLRQRLYNSMIVTKLHTVLPQFAYWPRTARMIWAAAPGWTAAWALLLIIDGVIPVASVYITRPLIDSLVAVLRDKSSASIWTAGVLVVLMAVLQLAGQVLQSLLGWVRTAQAEFVQDHVSALIHRQSATVDMAFYDSAEFHDQLHRARDEAGRYSIALLESAGGLVQNAITLTGMAVVLLAYGVAIPLVLLVSTLPAFFVVVRFDQRYYAWWHQSTAQRRLANYYDFMLTESHVAGEVRLYNLGDRFQTMFQRLRHQLRSERLGILRTQSLANLVAGMLSLLIAGAAIGWMVWRAFQGLVTLGDLALFYQAFDRGQAVMRTLLGNVGQLLSNSLFLSNLYAFLSLEPRITSPAQPAATPATLRQGVTFRNVTFRYPASERLALRDFNLVVPAGKIVAIVGENGAGKSTFIKLLCRFYDPDAGAIELDGVDIRRFAVDELRRMLTVLFQFPTAYQATASENIALGSWAQAPAPDDIERAARAAGAHEFIARLPQGYDTLLGKWFVDGAELSGGEWQRVAMARAFLRQAQLVVLDEPTSFMDSWAEADWFERLRTMMIGRTGIIITHRFTIAMRADVIHVMDSGQIIESGTHHELLARGGRYAESWHEQMRAAEAAEEHVL